MNTINDRISAVVKASGLTKTAFAEKINVTQSFISRVTSGTSTPSDRTILDICREFNVNEQWLRTGEGEMFLQLTRRDEIAAFLGDVLRDQDESFRSRLISALARLDANGWDLAEKFVSDLMDRKEESPESKKES